MGRCIRLTGVETFFDVDVGSRIEDHFCITGYQPVLEGIVAARQDDRGATESVQPAVIPRGQGDGLIDTYDHRLRARGEAGYIRHGANQWQVDRGELRAKDAALVGQVVVVHVVGLRAVLQTHIIAQHA